MHEKTITIGIMGCNILNRNNVYSGVRGCGESGAGGRNLEGSRVSGYISDSNSSLRIG